MTPSPIDSHASRMLAAIESVLEGKVTSDVASYSIAGRSITKIPIAELIELREKYRKEYENEVLAWQGKKKPKRILNRFV